MLLYAFLPYFIITAILLGFCIGCVSSYNVVRRWSLIGDIMSHSALPGIVYMFFFTQTKSIGLLLIGGAISSFISTLLSFYVQKYFTIPRDTSFALVLSWFFSVGIIGMVLIQKQSIEGQSLINNFIFGNFITFATMASYWYLIFSIVVLLFFLTTKQIQQAIGFDSLYSTLSYENTILWERLFLIFSIITIVIGLQSVGVLLMGALIIAPGTTARLWTYNYSHMMYYSMIIGALAFIFGIFICFRFSFIPTGPVIALFPICLCLLTVCYQTVNKYRFSKSKSKENI